MKEGGDSFGPVKFDTAPKPQIRELNPGMTVCSRLGLEKVFPMHIFAALSAEGFLIIAFGCANFSNRVAPVDVLLELNSLELWTVAVPDEVFGAGIFIRNLSKLLRSYAKVSRRFFEG